MYETSSMIFELKLLNFVRIIFLSRSCVTSCVVRCVAFKKAMSELLLVEMNGEPSQGLVDAMTQHTSRFICKLR